MKRTIVIKDADADSAALSPRFWKMRAALTFLCALTADGLQWLIPFLWPVFDAGMVFATLILWGWRWEVLIAVIPELIPGIELAPTWTLFAAYLVATRRSTSPSRAEPKNVTPSN
jgi:hypothetical protein